MNITLVIFKYLPKESIFNRYNKTFPKKDIYPTNLGSELTALGVKKYLYWKQTFPPFFDVLQV